MRLRAYECNVAGRDWQTIVNHTTPGKAKSEYLRNVRDAWPDVTYRMIRVRVAGPPSTSEAFAMMRLYRKIPAAHVGMVVQVGEHRGVIVGHNSSANLDVLFGPGRLDGQILNCHPNWDIRYFEGEDVVYDFTRKEVSDNEERLRRQAGEGQDAPAISAKEKGEVERAVEN